MLCILRYLGQVQYCRPIGYCQVQARKHNYVASSSDNNNKIYVGPISSHCNDFTNS